MADGVDPLFEVKNFFHLGCYQAAINAASTIAASSPDLKVEMDTYVFRAYAALDTDATALLAVRELVIGSTDEVGRATALETFRKWLGDGISAGNAMVVLGAAQLMVADGAVDEALTLLSGSTELEPMAYMVYVYLQMNQVRYAEEKVKAMVAIEEDNTLTQLAGAWVGIAKGKSALQEAYHVFQDFVDKYQPSTKLLNGVAACCMHQGNFEEAEAVLVSALELNANDADTLANLIALAQHTGKASDVIDRYMAQLAARDAAHPLLASKADLETRFAAAAAAL
ncbi:protein transporter [Thecamonas trahens ATCC 50062]|uniref:Coatomer subunit epsilon n=1 Tax=Thecamonas trahens ATCC 50062 TaxID=461836 RepID=A0A0L0DLF7_THETB|nr:protein transporter [Thecamonas trahens ATCC 50062]KNC53065.1 protein transporter [Thecamonas trahens ATCC 50062]|eukprot:XP_013754741.1 protein transporter [Thecamonas trahens ATCC 50062]